MVSMALTTPLGAQEPAPPPPSPAASPADTTAPTPPVSPFGAFWRSLLIPGWGQAKLDRHVSGAIFLAAEGLALGMALKVNQELQYLEDTGSERTDAKQQELEDWLVILGFNHLMSALEAYVAAHLWDFPGDLQIRAGPGHVGGGVSVPVRIP
jgi:hypothetical protein